MAFRIRIEFGQFLLASGGVKPVPVQPQIRSADDRPPGDGYDRVQVLGSGHEDSLPRCPVADELAGLHGFPAESLVVRHAFPCDRQPCAQEGDHRCNSRKEPPSTQSLQAFPDAGTPIRHDQAAQEPGQVEQLDIVVFVWLEADELRRQNDRQGHREDPPVPRMPVKQRCQQGEEGQPDILDIEPQVQVPHAPAGRIVHPVELQNHEGMVALLEGLAEGKADQLRQCKGRGNRAVNQVREQDPAPAPPVRHRPRITVDQVVAQAARRRQTQGEEAVGMDQRQRASPYAQQDDTPSTVLRIPGFRPELREQQVVAGDDHAPPAQDRPLGDHQVADHIAPSQVVRIRLVRRRLVVAVHDMGNPFRDRPEPVRDRTADTLKEVQSFIGTPGPAGQVKVVKEAQAAIQEEQAGCQQGSLLSPRHLPAEDDHAHITQGHHQGPGEDDRCLQAAAQKDKSRAQAVRQEGIAQPRPREERVICGELLPCQSRDKARMHRQVTVGALADAPVAGSPDPQRMSVLQEAAEEGQRDADPQQLAEQAVLLFIPAGRVPPVPEEPAQERQKEHYNSAENMRCRAKGKEERSNGRKPHLAEQAKAQSEPDPVQRTVAGQQETNRRETERQKHHRVHDGSDHRFSSSPSKSLSS